MDKWIIAAILALPFAEMHAVTPNRIPTVHSEEIEVALWTIHPGSDLADRWGHNGLRVYLPNGSFDKIYNWGTYDFNQSWFYLNFANGRLPYTLSVSPQPDAIAYYAKAKRRIVENKLNLSPSEKIDLIDLVNANLDDPAFLYHYRIDNCATRIRDLLDKVLSGRISAKFKTEATYRHFRADIRERLADRPIIAAVLDMLLNKNVDQPMNQWDRSYLPENFKDNLNEFLPNLLEPDKIVLDFSFVAKGRWWIGYLMLGLFHALLCILTLGKLKSKNSKTAIWTSLRYWGVFSGVLGGVMSYAWLATDHIDLKANILLLVFWPTDLLVLWKKAARSPLFLMTLKLRPVIFFILLGIAPTFLVDQAVVGPLVMVMPLILLLHVALRTKPN